MWRFFSIYVYSVEIFVWEILNINLKINWENPILGAKT